MEAFGDITFWEVLAPLLAVAAGALVTLLVLARQTQSDQEVEAQSRRIDLQSTVDDSLEVLRALETEQGKMDPAEYASEREAVLARGAQAMAALDDAAPAGDAEPDEVPEPGGPAAAQPEGWWSQQTPLVRGLIHAGGAMAAILVFVYFAGVGSTERAEGMGMTGGTIVNEDQANANPELKALIDRVEKDPADIEALNTLTQVYLNAQQARPAMDYNQKALAADPEDHTARALRGMLTLMMGMTDRALEQVDGVLAEDPSHPLAATYRGLFLLHMDRYDEAVPALETASRLLPGNPGILRALADARAQAAGERPPSAGELLVGGTMVLAPGAQVAPTDVVFVSIKEPGQRQPIAATRIGPRFPGPFELNSTHFMAGERPVPDTVTLSIRVDRDGNVTTREDAPAAELQVTRGASDLVVSLSGGGPAAPSPAAPGPAAAGGEVLVSGTARLSGGATGAGQVLYISLRDPAGGPPFAAIRRTEVSFPYDFELTSSDLIPMMAGRPLPSALSLTVRLDNDGDPITKAGEPSATLAVDKGARGVTLTLQ